MMLYQPKFVADNIIDIVDRVRRQASAVYSSPSSCRSVTYLTMISGVTCGMSLSGPIFASCTAARNRSVGAIDPRIGGFRPLVVVQQRQQRSLALPFGQSTHRGLEPLQPGGVVADALDRVAGVDEPVDVLVEPDAVVVRVHHVVGLEPVDHPLRPVWRSPRR